MSKKFPSKKSVKFDLLPRSQKDPLLFDDDASPLVLIPKRRVDEKHVNDIDPSLLPSKSSAKKGNLQKAYEKDGITLDTDILVAMSKDFNYDDPNNKLDDDFFQQAGGLIEDDSDDDVEFAEYIDFNAKHDVADQMFFDEDVEMEEDYHSIVSRQSKPKSKAGSNFSMTSSVMRRSEGLQQIDEHFDRMFEKEYANDADIGALDLNEVRCEELLGDMEKIRSMKQEVKEVRKRNFGGEYTPKVETEHHKTAIIGSDEEEDLVETEIEKRENRIDCESILSYNSTLYNHPKLIVEPRKKKSSDMHDEVMEIDSNESEKYDSESDNNAMSVASSRATLIAKLSSRKSDETPEERRARKNALKNYRKMRREEKKTNQKIFKAEKAHISRLSKTEKPAIKLR